MKNPIVALVLVAGMMASFAGTAHADNDWNRHAHNAQTWHRQNIHRGHVVRRGPEYVQEDPYNTVYAPPVVVDPPESGINLIFPLNFR